MSQLTPMLQQYMDIKQNTKDALVFYRLGDFYELFFEDAITASKALDLVLTSRSSGNKEKAPMCGVPHHAAKNYIQKLIAKGYKVAIVEQVEDPKTVKGIVKREVIEIVTPGTYFDSEEMTTKEIASIHTDLVYATLVSVDIISGSVKAVRVINDAYEIIKVLRQFQVRELVVNSEINPELIQEIKNKTDITISYEEKYVEETLHKDPFINRAYQNVLFYLEYTQKRKLDHLQDLEYLEDKAYLKMDYNTMVNLELIDHDNQQLSLYDYINHTETNMGSKALRNLIMRPYVNTKDIQNNHTYIDYLRSNLIVKDKIKDLLKNSYDIHRIVARITTQKHNTHDFLRLNKTLHNYTEIQKILVDTPLQGLVHVDDLSMVQEVLTQVFQENAPALLKEGQTFNPGISAELDELVQLSKNGKEWLLNYENEQKEITGIKNLKIGYNKAFGYFIEISKGQIENVRDEFGYVRKQTLTNAERYINEELSAYEERVTTAWDKISAIEQELFDYYTQYIHEYLKQIHTIGSYLAKIDVIYSLVEVSLIPGFTKPKFVEENKLYIKDGRHPVLEGTIQSHSYISSDIEMNNKRQILLLTGPNMGGKSTYMRMIAQNVILAQMGSYIPCTEAILSINDQIFTRMGASDDILSGQSTFMVEMMEAKNALSKATKNSLILFDELGRGTSTYDGMALASAIIEYVVEVIGCKTIFSTHYHELVTLEEMYDTIHNIHVEVHEENNHVTFLYKVMDGKADKSYGINVARLAHLPTSVIHKAQENLELLEADVSTIDLDRKLVKVEIESQATTNIKNRLESLNIEELKPIEALLVLEELKGFLQDE